ncbi:MAG TPA: S4 domain-containing protein, partial [Candidatus Acidoferrum sp.]|nr:S4 domain-containing protein [Candidatus Acidoferrum sp.]
MTSDSSKDVRTSELLVPPGEKAGRLDKYLATHPECGLSRTRIQRLITERQILVDGKLAAHNHFLKGGETIRITIPPSPELDFSGEDIPIQIVFEDQ